MSTIDMCQPEITTCFQPLSKPHQREMNKKISCVCVPAVRSLPNNCRNLKRISRICMPSKKATMRTSKSKSNKQACKLANEQARMTFSPQTRLLKLSKKSSTHENKAASKQAGGVKCIIECHKLHCTEFRD